MSLDKNLFTLLFTPNKDAPNVTDLVDPAGTIHYRKQRIPGSTYAVEVYDPMSESLLVKVSAPATTSKTKVLELCNPTSVVELKYTGTLSFRWSFKWEDHEFEWKREECYMLRKPDPPVLVAITKEPAGRIKTKTVQILDYNLNRFDIEDRKGLEIVILTALLTFQDANDAYHATPPTPSRQSSGPTPSEAAAPPPPPPPRPEPKSGVDRIAELQAIRGELNEVTVEDEGSFEDYARYSANLLADEAMLFITIRSSEASQVPKVLQVVEETKRIRHKAGIYDEDELHQYVVYDTVKAKGPRRINLDDEDPAKAKYTPPNSLSVHLSKIPMPELQPKASVKDKDDSKRRSAPPPVPSSSSPEAKSKDAAKLRRPRSKSPARQSKPAHSLPKQSPPKHSPRVHSHQVHPNQPSPSPSQLNNPYLYTAPPPPPPQRSSFYGSFMSRPPPPPPPPSEQQQHQSQHSLSGVVSGFLGSMRR